MAWTTRREREGIVEWERDDGYATIRRRERGGGGVVVRLDVLEQAVDGPSYRRESVADVESASELVETWRTEFAVEE